MGSLSRRRWRSGPGESGVGLLMTEGRIAVFLDVVPKAYCHDECHFDLGNKGGIKWSVKSSVRSCGKGVFPDRS